ncbi:AtpZ/AtpI family protein [Patescibacteria group bacterium]
MSDSDKDRKFMLLGLRIVGEFGAVIAVPVVLLSMLGKWLDTRYDTAPKLLILCFVLAAVISGAAIYRRAKRFGDMYFAIDPEGFGMAPKGTDDESAEPEDTDTQDQTTGQ